MINVAMLHKDYILYKYFIFQILRSCFLGFGGVGFFFIADENGYIQYIIIVFKNLIRDKDIVLKPYKNK